MTKIIEFHIPQSFRKASKWFPPSQAGKVLAFPPADTKIDVFGTEIHRAESYRAG